MWPQWQVLITIKMDIDTVLFSSLQLITLMISMRYKRKEIEQSFKTTITSSKHVTVRPKLVTALFEIVYRLYNYFFPLRSCNKVQYGLVLMKLIFLKERLIFFF